MTIFEFPSLATEALSVREHFLQVELPAALTLARLDEVIQRNEQLLGDVRAVAFVFSAGDFAAVVNDSDRIGWSGRALAIRRRVPVAWVVAPAERELARSWALRFASWGLLRGVFVERESALAWLRLESLSGRPATQ